MTTESCLYAGAVVHERFRPKRHRLRYGVFNLLLDLDELPRLDSRLNLFAYNRRGPVSFHDSDHGPADGSPLRPWAEARMREIGVEPDGGPIRLLCYPRILGYVFNPISVYYCYRMDGALAATLYEVCNTFRERFTYAIPAGPGERPVIRQRCAKQMYVSPFIGMEAEYHFRVTVPSDRLSLVIRQEDSGGLMLAAAFAGTRRPLDDRVLALLLARFPLLTLKVMAGIHWEALRMWLKGFPVFRHSPATAPVRSGAGRLVSPRS
jgi:DUF1365 family protein